MNNKNKLNYSDFCPEVTAVLKSELALGNILCQPPHIIDWPKDGSVYTSLVHDFKSDKKSWPKEVRHYIFNDYHYGWYEECYCKIHKHLLVAGRCR